MSFNRANSDTPLLDVRASSLNHYASMDDGINDDVDSIASDEDNVAIDADLSVEAWIMPNRTAKSTIGSGVRLVADIVFPLAFWGLLIRDINEFSRHPENRYGNTLLKMLLGLSSNTQTYTSLLNINLVQSPLWQPSLALPLAMILMGGANYVLQKNLRYVDDWDSIPNNIIYNFFAPLWPRSQFNRFMREVEDRCLDDKDLLNKDYDAEEATIIKFIDDFLNRRGLARFYGSQLISNYFNIISQSQAERLESLSQSGIKHKLSRYHLWQSGLSTNKLDNIFLLRHFFKDYPKLMLILMGVHGAVDTIKDLLRRSQCKHAGNMYRHSNTFSVNECVVCDWDILPAVYSQEACVNSALQHSNSPGQVLARLKQLKTGLAISSIDFSNQDINLWSDAEFNQVLTQLERIATGPLKKLDFSQNVGVGSTLSVRMVKRLGDFLQSITVEEVNLANNELDDDLMMEMLAKVNNSSIKSLHLFGNNLSDEFTLIIANKLMSGELMLEQLDVSGNEVLGINLSVLAEYTNQSNSTLANINLSYNPISNGRLNVFLDKIDANSTLSGLDISGIQLQSATVDKLSKALLRSSYLTNIGLKNTNLISGHTSYLLPCMGKVERLNIADNHFSQADIGLLLQDATQGVLDELDVSGNNIQRLEVAVRHIPATLSKINLSSNLMRDTNFTLAFDYLGASNLTDIALANVGVSAEDLGYFATVFRTRSTPLLGLDISQSGLENEGLSSILSIDTLQQINMSGNLLNDTSIIILTDGLINNSALRGLAVDNVGLTEAGAISLFRATIAPTPHIQDLSLPSISRDEARALFRDSRHGALEELSLRGLNNTPAIDRAYLRSQPATSLQTHGLFLPNSERQNQFSMPTSASYLVIASGYGIAIGLFLVLFMIHKVYTYINEQRKINKLSQNR